MVKKEESDDAEYTEWQEKYEKREMNAMQTLRKYPHKNVLRAHGTYLTAEGEVREAALRQRPRPRQTHRQHQHRRQTPASMRCGALAAWRA